MNKISILRTLFALAIAIGGINFFSPIIMAQEKGGSISGDIKIGFRMNPKNQLFLDIVNLSDTDKSVSTNIESVVNLKFQGFPKGWTLQFRSAKNAVLKLKDQGNDGWMDPFIYSSSLLSDEKMKEADVMSDVRIRSKSTLPYAIEYKGVFRLIDSDIPEKNPKAHEFRVRCSIKLMESGKVIQKEVISDWLPVNPT